MALNLPGVPFKLNASDVGAPDYQSAMQQGFKTSFMPGQLAQDLLRTQIANKLESAKIPYADRLAKANLDHLLASTGLIGAQTGSIPLENQLRELKIQSLKNEFEQNKNFADLLKNGVNGENDSSMLTNPTNSSQNISNNSLSNGNFPNEQVINEGNPSLYQLDEMYDKFPQYRKNLEQKGFKKTQVTKVDPRTGVSSTVITYPSGKVEVKTIPATDTGFAPLTNAVKTLNQNAVNFIPKVQTQIDEIIKAPSPVTPFGEKYSGIYRGSSVAKHQALVNEAADTLVKAKGWPNTNESLNTAKHILARGNFETDYNYRERLKELKKSLGNDIKSAKSILKQGTNVVNNADFSTGQVEQKTINGKTYTKINGEWHET